MTRSEFMAWSGCTTEEEVKNVTAHLEKRFKKLILLGLIPVLNLVVMGMALFTYNNLVLFRSHGRDHGGIIGALLRFFMIIYGYLLPLLWVNLFAKFDSLGARVLGIK